MVKSITFFLLSICATLSIAQAKVEFLTLEQTRGRSEQAFKLLEKGDIDGGFKYLSKNTAVLNHELESALANTKNQFNNQLLRIGKQEDSGFYRTETVRDYLIRHTYLMKYEYGLIRWYFIFYKSNQGWSLNSQGFDSNTAGMFLDKLLEK
jgi:hypothetical protein